MLTKRNPDPEALGLPDTVAWNAFTALWQQGLLVPIEVPTEDGGVIDAFALNLGNEEAWKNALKTPGVLSLFVWRPAHETIKSSAQYALTVLAGVISAIAGAVVTAFLLN